MRLFIAPVLWFGRVSLWFVFLPLGLWRSIVHGRKKSEKRLAKRIVEAQRKTP
jgi:hypothetical protein